MLKLKSIKASVFGDIEQIESESYFLTVTCFSASLFLMVLCAFHITLRLNIVLVEIAGLSSLTIAGLYLLVGSSHLLGTDPDNESKKKYIDIIQHNSDHLLRVSLLITQSSSVF